MTFSQRVANWRDRKPRQAALCIAALLVGLLALDATRLHRSRKVIAHSDWDYAFRVGLGFGFALLALGGVLWLVSRRFPVVRRPIEVLAVVVVLFVFGSAHHRYGDDSINEPWEVTYVVAWLVLFAALLTYAAIYRWTRPPIEPLDG